MKIKCFINWKDFDKNGNLISEYEHEANSLVRQFIQVLQIHFSQTGQYIKTTAGASPTTTADSANFRITAGAGDATFGIVVGTGTTAVAITDYVLQTLIAHGGGSGQLSYGAVSVDTNILTSGSTDWFTISRSFTNGSGSDITIEEIGLIFSGSSYKFLIDRSLSTKTVTNGTASTCTYKFKITV